MSGQDVDDHGLQVLSKAALPLTPGNKSQYKLRVSVTDGVITGSFTPSGLKIAFLPTVLDVGDTAVPLPTTPLTDRNSMVITNHSATDILYVGNSDVTADLVIGTTSGHQINPGEGWGPDIQDDIVLYGRAETGKTIRVQISEFA